MRAIVVVVTALVVVGAGAPLVAASGDGIPASDSGTFLQSTSDTVDDKSENESANESTAPGARLAGVVNVQAAEVEGEMEGRSFGLQMAAARSNSSKAAVVATQAGELNETITELRERKQTLVEAKQNGNISQGRFRAEMAGLATELSTARKLSNATADTARGLSSADLEAGGVNVAAIEELQTSASELSGPAVSSIARDIAGVSGNSSEGPPFGLGDDRPGFGDVPGVAGGDNRTVGPDDNRTVGPNDNRTVGSDDTNEVTPNRTSVPNTTDIVDATTGVPDVNKTLEVPDVVSDTTVDSSLNTTTVAEYTV